MIRSCPEDNFLAILTVPGRFFDPLSTVLRTVLVDGDTLHSVSKTCKMVKNLALREKLLSGDLFSTKWYYIPQNKIDYRFFYIVFSLSIQGKK